MVRSSRGPKHMLMAPNDPRRARPPLGSIHSPHHSPALTQRPCAASVCCRCLLEICEAMRLRIPIVLLELKGRSTPFSFDEAFALLANLEHNLPFFNPAAVSELRAHLGDVPLQETVKQALDAGRTNGVRHLDINGCAHDMCCRATSMRDYTLALRRVLMRGV